MGERPILMSGPMVRAVLDGRKTQTRRSVKPQSMFDGKDAILRRCPEQHGCPFGTPGDRLWVKETWGLFHPGMYAPEAVARKNIVIHPGHEYECAGFKADGEVMYQPSGGWKPSIHMPRWASRLTLEITGVRVERLQDIGWMDAIAEGMRDPRRAAVRINYEDPRSPVAQFRELWEELNGPSSWNDNPWVWAITFRVVGATGEER